MSLADFLNALDESDDPERALLDRTLRQAEQRSPALSFTLRACAIPLRFDAAVIGALRGEWYDTAGNADLLAQLQDYSFVLRREDGGFNYHDRVRNLLLEDWATPERREEFEQLSRRVAEHLEGLYAEAAAAEEDAARVGRIVQRASARRYAQIAAVLETRLVDPLLQAIQQLTPLGPAATLELVERHTSAFVDMQRAAALLVIVRAARDAVLASPDDDDRRSALHWLTYWEAFALNRSYRAADAERLLEDLLDADVHDEILLQWTLGELGIAQEAQFNTGKARETYQKQVATALATDVDSHNRPVAYVRLANALMRDRPGEALEPLLEAVRIAETDPEASHALVGALISLSSCYADLGRREDARATTLKALDHVRQFSRTERVNRAWVAETLMWLFVDDGDPQWLDTITQEREALISGVSDPALLLEHRFDRVDTLIANGQLKRAKNVLDRLRPDVLATSDRRLRIRLARVTGGLHEDSGELDEAVAAYDACSRDSGSGEDDDVRANALYRSGWVRMRMGQLDLAERDLVEAEDLWTQQGADTLGAVARIDRSRIERKRSNVTAARALLESAAHDLQAASVSSIADLKLAECELERRCGHSELAAARAREATELAVASGSRSQSAAALTALSVAARECGAWSEASDAAVRLAEQYRALGQAADYRRTTARKKADDENGQGVRTLASDSADSIRAARDLFRSAISRIPDEPWYRLNLAYALGGLDDPGAAASELSTALSSDARLRCPALEARLAAFRLEHAEQLLVYGEPGEAAAAFETALATWHGPDHAELPQRALMGLGESRDRAGDGPGAVEAFRRAREAGDTTAWLRLFETLAEIGESDSARDVAWETLREGDPLAALEASVQLHLQAEGDELDSEVAEALRLAQGDAQVEQLGERLETAGRPAGARAAYELVSEISALAALRLGDLHVQYGDPDAAREAYEGSISLARASSDGIGAYAAYRLGDVLVQLDEPGPGAEAFELAIAHGDEDVIPWAYQRLGELRHAAGDLDGALMAYETVAELPMGRAALLRIGELQLARGDLDAAETAYRTALDEAGGHLTAEAAAALLGILSRAGREDERSPVIDQVLAQGAQTALVLADTLWGSGELECAEDVLVRAAVLENDLWAPDAALRLGELRRARGDADGAAEALTQAAESSDLPVAARATIQLAELHNTPAAEMIGHVAAGGARRLMALSDALRAIYDDESAEAALRAAVALENDAYSSDAALALGDLLVDRGDAVGARLAYRAAVASGDAFVAPVAQERMDALAREVP